MAKVSTSISIDSEVKAKAQELFADFGMDLSFPKAGHLRAQHPIRHSSGTSK